MRNLIGGNESSGIEEAKMLAVITGDGFWCYISAPRVESLQAEATNDIVMWFLQMQARQHPQTQIKLGWSSFIRYQNPMGPLVYTVLCYIVLGYPWIEQGRWARERESNRIECDRKISRKNIFLSSNKFCFLSSFSRIAHTLTFDRLFAKSQPHLYSQSNTRCVWNVYINCMNN